MAAKKLPMSEADFRHWVDNVAAMSLATNGIVACMLAGVEPTAEHVIPVAGRFLDPSNPHFEQMALAVEKWRVLTIEAANSLSLDVRRS